VFKAILLLQCCLFLVGHAQEEQPQGNTTDSIRNGKGKTIVELVKLVKLVELVMLVEVIK
jgi:hypothetical protein